MLRRFSRFSSIVLIAGFSAACASAPQPAIGNSTIPKSGFDSDTIVVKHPSFGMYARTSMRLEALVWMKGEHIPSPDAPLHWTSSNVNVAWVSESGVLTLLSPGKTTLTAKSGTMRTAKSIVVQSNPVARIKLASATQAEVHAGDIVQLVARAETESGTRIPDARLAYAVNLRGMPHTAGVMVSGEGLFTAEQPGDYLIIAASGGISGHTVIRVLPRASTGAGGISSGMAARKVEIDDVDYEGAVGTSIPLSASVRVGNSKEQRRDASISWSSSAPEIAWVDAMGVVTFNSTGRVTITAQSGGKQASKKFNVQRESAARIALVVNSSDVRTGDAVKLREEVWQKGGTPLRRARVNYAVVAHGSNAAARLASISDDRIFVASQPGVYTIIAELGGLAEQTTIVVRGRGAAGVSLR